MNSAILGLLCAMGGMNQDLFYTGERKGVPLKCENEIKMHTCPCCGNIDKRDQSICSKECLLEMRKRQKIKKVNS